MKLLVRVIEARNIPAMDPNGFSDPYVKLSLGKQKFRSKVVKKCLNPSWCEEFAFKVDDLKEELIISVLDEDKYFNDDFVGQIKFPVSQVFETNDKSLGTAWYTLHPKHKKGKTKDCGQILLTICFSQGNTLADLQSLGDHGSKKLSSDVVTESPLLSSNAPLRSSSPLRSEEAASSKEEKHPAQTFAGRLAQIFNKNGDAVSTTNAKAPDVTVPTETASTAISENAQEEQSTSGNFQELLKSMETREQPSEVSNLPGVVVDQLYAIAPHELNSFLFSPDSTFFKSLADAQGSTDVRVGPWKLENGGESLKRVVTFIKAASRLVRALKTTEDQTYIKADGKSFAVLVIVSTPDAPYGSTFRTELLYSITPGPELPSGEQSSRLVVSWRMNFLQSTMMKGMIENGARQGIKESFDQYANLLSQNIKPVDAKDIGSEKEQILASLEVEHQSDWKLAVQYFANFTVVSTFFIGLYVFVHVLLAMPSTIQGLEFVGLDLPDSIGEVIVCGVLVLQGKRVLELISRFMRARVQKGSDHGIKAQGNGWLLTVALIEGNNLAAVDSSGYSDPYVVFTCNGKSRTSSIKFQKSNPKWNEIFEFDAVDDPPSVLDVEVFDFDGPFSEATSLGHAEINFIKSNISDLSDVWIPLQGKLAQACQSKLHLRVFLNNTKGKNVVKDYLSKMEKEVGKKIKLRSPQTNSAFQKLFGLPPEEFLINDFACHLKRKMPLQGRLFLSARIIGFHSDLFGHKTKFFLLWEDIEDIQVESPTLASMGSPNIIMTLKPGRGFDARHGAKTQDKEGRLKFHFHSFVSFNVANRTIMALWKARALSPEQKVRIVEEESEAKNIQMAEEDSMAEAADDDSEGKSLHSEESGSFMGVDDINMSIVYSSVLSVPTEFFMEVFGGGELDRKVMERAGCSKLEKGEKRRLLKVNGSRLSTITHQGMRKSLLNQRSHSEDDDDLCVLEDISAPAKANPCANSKSLVALQRTTITDSFAPAEVVQKRFEVGQMRPKLNDEHVIYQAALQDLSQPKSEESPPDGLLAVPLLRHQRIALSWMVKKEKAGVPCCGGILADDQGLGKTISTIALILKERSPSSRLSTAISRQTKPETLNLDDDDVFSELDKANQGADASQVDETSSNVSKTSFQAKGRPAAGTLVVCPTSVLRQWSEELHKKVTSKANLSVLVYHGSSRTKDPVELAKYDVVVTTYSIVSMEVPKQPLAENDDETGKGTRELPASKKRKTPLSSKKSPSKAQKEVDKELLEDTARPLARVGWYRVVLDEAQSIKNYRTQVARACWGLRAKRRWCLSGTPIQNAVDDLYSYFRFLKYDPYAVYKQFCTTIKVPIQRHPTTGYRKLQAVLKTVMLRRTKGTCIDGKPIINLPEKRIVLRKVEFTDKERDFYCKLEAQSRAQFAEYAAAGTLKQNYVNILLMLLRLRQACDHPLLVGASNSGSVWRSSIEEAKKLPREKLTGLLNCLEASLAICGICSDPPEDAVVTVCGHVFCNQCISEHLSGDDTQCPVSACKAHLSGSKVFTKAMLSGSLSGEPSLERNLDGAGSEVAESSICTPYDSSKIKAALQVLQSLPKPKVCTRSGRLSGSDDKGASPSENACDNHAGESSMDETKDTTTIAGEKAIVFSQWTGMLDLLEACLKKTSIQYRRLDGTMSVLARDKAVKDFNTLPEVTVIIMSLKAASLGLNMVAACHVLLLDLWWNPTTEDQAIDRAHRIGQTRPVTVLRLTVKDTVEDRILALQQKKREMVASAFGEDETGSRQTRLTVEDLEYLFKI